MDANYNLSGLTDRIKARLKDAQYSDTDIQQFINDAYFDILGDTAYQFLEKAYRASTQDGGPMFLPPDYQTLIHLTATKDHNKHALRYIPSRQFFDTGKNASVKNYTYTIFGNQLYYSLPDIEGELDEEGDEKFYTLDLYYLARPKMLVQPTDKPVIPYEYGEALLLGALARAEQLRDNFDYAQIYENKKEELITNMKERYCPRQQEGENRAKLPVFQKTRY
jgi:hypothetical protein